MERTINLELLFLGTGAHDYSPKLKDEFKNKFDKNARRSSSLLIDGKILVDCGDFVLNSMEIAGINPAGITHLFVTHSHGDHFQPYHVSFIANAGIRVLQVYCSAAVATQITPSDKISVHTVTHGEVVTDGAFEAIPLHSNHFVKSGEQTYHYLFNIDGKKLFYGLDGALLPTATANYLHRKEIDFCVFDGTVGNYIGDYRIFEHNSIPMVRQMVCSLKTVGAFSPSCKIYISHLAHSLHKPHEDTVCLLQKDGIHVAYDGLLENC